MPAPSVNSSAHAASTNGTMRMFMALSLLFLSMLFTMLPMAGRMPLTTMPTPQPTITPMPSDVLIADAVARSQYPAETPPTTMPMSPMSAPKNHTNMNTGPMM